MIRICFVCMGNICRSPTADGIMTALVREAGLADVIEVDSAGTSAWHVGERADRRSRQVAQARGYDLTSLARQFDVADFEHFDYVLAMDAANRKVLETMAPSAEARKKVRLFRSFDPEVSAAANVPDVPDPYYGELSGFAEVFDICERTCRNLLRHICEEDLGRLGSGAKPALAEKRS